MTIRAYDHFMHTGGDYPGINTPMQNMHGIIKNCLVFGSGGVPAAGWNIEYDEGEPTGTFVLSNGDRDFFICFSLESTYTIRVSIAASFEGIDPSGYIMGESARSGMGPGVTSPAFFRTQFFLGRSTSELNRGGWAMLADPDTCSIVFSSGSFTSSYLGSGLDINFSDVYRYGGGFSFGKTSEGFGYVTGTISDANIQFHIHPGENMFVLHDPSSGLLIPSSEAIPQIDAGIKSMNATVYAQYTATKTFVDQPVLPLEAYMQSSETVGPGYLGKIRGFIQMPWVDTRIYPRHILNSLGMADDDFETMRLQDLSKFRIGTDGYKYAYAKLASGSSNLSQVFLTDNPMVW